MLIRKRSFVSDEIESGFASSLAISFSGSHIFVGAPFFDMKRGEVRVFDLATGRMITTYEGHEYYQGYGTTVAFNQDIHIGLHGYDVASDGTHLVVATANKVSMDNLDVSGSMACVSRYFCTVWHNGYLHIYGFIMGRWQSRPLCSISSELRPQFMAMTDSYLYIARGRLIEVYENGNDREWELVNVLYTDFAVTALNCYRNYLLVGTTVGFIFFYYDSSTTHKIGFVGVTDGACTSICMHNDSVYVGQALALAGDGLVEEYEIDKYDVILDFLTRARI